MDKYGDSNPKVVIIGSSFIGMEAASILAKKAQVTVVGMEKVPFERVLGKAVGGAMLKLNESSGVTMKMNSLLDHYEPKNTGGREVGYVVLKSGEKIECDLVILGAGVVPKTDYLKSSGITLDKDGGISVDTHMAVPGVENVFAIGDIARYPYHLTGEKLRIEHWNVAQNQGRIAAKNICHLIKGSDKLEPFLQIPYFWTVQFGKSLRYVGHASSFEETIVHGSFEDLTFAAFFVREGVVVAVCSLGKDPVVSHSSELMRLGKMPSAAQLKEGLDILSVKLHDSKEEEVLDHDPKVFNIIAVLVIAFAFGYSYFVSWMVKDHIGMK